MGKENADVLVSMEKRPMPSIPNHKAPGDGVQAAERSWKTKPRV